MGIQLDFFGKHAPKITNRFNSVLIGFPALCDSLCIFVRFGELMIQPKIAEKLCQTKNLYKSKGRIHVIWRLLRGPRLPGQLVWATPSQEKKFLLGQAAKREGEVGEANLITAGNAFYWMPPVIKLLAHKPRKELNCFSLFQGPISRPTGSSLPSTQGLPP